MKFSKLLHVASVAAGFIGTVVFFITVFGNADAAFGITKADSLACSAILILIAIWIQAATIHHMMLERKGEIV